MIYIFIIYIIHSFVKARNIHDIINERYEIDSNSSSTVSFNSTVDLDDKCLVFFIKMNFSLISLTFNDKSENNSLFRISRQGGKIIS